VVFVLRGVVIIVLPPGFNPVDRVPLGGTNGCELVLYALMYASWTGIEPVLLTISATWLVLLIANAEKVSSLLKFRAFCAATSVFPLVTSL
jgi:hypothetical protein